jgi:hypothetical protein
MSKKQLCKNCNQKRTLLKASPQRLQELDIPGSPKLCKSCLYPPSKKPPDLVKQIHTSPTFQVAVPPPNEENQFRTRSEKKGIQKKILFKPESKLIQDVDDVSETEILSSEDEQSDVNVSPPPKRRKLETPQDKSNIKPQDVVVAKISDEQLQHIKLKWGENSLIFDSKGCPLAFCRDDKLFFIYNADLTAEQSSKKFSKIVYDSFNYSRKKGSVAKSPKRIKIGVPQNAEILKNQLEEEKQKCAALQKKLEDPVISHLVELLEQKKLTVDAPFYAYALFFVKWLEKGTTSFNAYPPWIIDFAISIQYLGGQRLLGFLRGNPTDAGSISKQIDVRRWNFAIPSYSTVKKHLPKTNPYESIEEQLIQRLPSFVRAYKRGVGQESEGNILVGVTMDEIEIRKGIHNFS